MAEEADDQSGGSGKVFLVMGILIGVAIGAGGGFYYFGGAPESDDPNIQKKERAEKEVLIPITFERIAVPIYATRGDRRRYVGNYFIDLLVNVRTEDDQIAVKRSQAQLQHSFISAISKADLMREDSPTELDVDKASRILKAKAAEVMGPGVIASVTIAQSMRISN